LVAALVLVSATARADNPDVPPDPLAAKPVIVSDKLVDAPLVAPASQLDVFGAVQVNTTTRTAAPVPPLTTGAKVINTAFELNAGVGYGVSDVLTLGGEYTFPFADADGAFPNAGKLRGFGGYSAIHDDKLTLVVGGDLDVEFPGSATLFIHAGASLRYKIAPKASIYTGNPLAPGPYGEQLTVAVNNNGPSTIDLPVGVGVQLSPKLFGWAQTTLAHINLANSANAFWIADFLPLEVGALFRYEHDIDLGGFIGSDFEDFRAGIVGGVMLRYYRHARATSSAAPSP
jgi:hypothetical protein